MGDEEDRLLRIERVARMLDCSRASVYRLTRAGLLRSERRRHLGRRYRLSEVRRYIAAREEGTVRDGG